MVQGFQKDIQTLGSTMFAEAQLTVALNRPDSYALLGNSNVLNDLLNLAVLKEITFAFLQYIAQHVADAIRMARRRSI